MGQIGEVLSKIKSALRESKFWHANAKEEKQLAVPENAQLPTEDTQHPMEDTQHPTEEERCWKEDDSDESKYLSSEIWKRKELTFLLALLQDSIVGGKKILLK